MENFIAPIQLALSCVTTAQITRSWSDAQDRDHALTVANGDPFILQRKTGRGLQARVLHNYRIVKAEGQRGPFKVKTTAYQYTLEDPDGHEILSYQWHPRVPGGPVYPHLHLGAAAHVGRSEVETAHLPTGRVALEDFLWLVIEAFNVKPRRTDWETVLYRARQKFAQWRTWE